MFEAVVKHYTLQDLNRFNKAMNTIRKNAKTKKDKITALDRQVKYFNLIHNANNELGGTTTNNMFFIPKTINQLSATKLDHIWYALRPRHLKSKKQAGIQLTSISQVLKMLGYSATKRLPSIGRRYRAGRYRGRRNIRRRNIRGRQPRQLRPFANAHIPIYVPPAPPVVAPPMPPLERAPDPPRPPRPRSKSNPTSRSRSLVSVRSNSVGSRIGDEDRLIEDNNDPLSNIDEDVEVTTQPQNDDDVKEEEEEVFSFNDSDQYYVDEKTGRLYDKTKYYKDDKGRFRKRSKREIDSDDEEEEEPNNNNNNNPSRSQSTHSRISANDSGYEPSSRSTSRSNSRSSLPSNSSSISWFPLGAGRHSKSRSRSGSHNTGPPSSSSASDSSFRRSISWGRNRSKPRITIEIPDEPTKVKKGKKGKRKRIKREQHSTRQDIKNIARYAREHRELYDGPQRRKKVQKYRGQDLITIDE